MGVFYETIPNSLFNWILAQKIFWVATAPLSGTGHVNVSPKGGPYFGLLDDKTFWYLDMTGSGSETISHIYEPGNGRVTIMFNAFEGPPRIVRLWGKGRVLESGNPDFANFVERYYSSVESVPAGVRSIIVVDIHQVGSSCGFSVPFYEFKNFRDVLLKHHEQKERKYRAGNEKESFPRYWASKNTWSVDGLPSMKTAQAVSYTEKIIPLKKMVGPLAINHGVPPKRGLASTNLQQRQFSLLFLLLVALLSFVMGGLCVPLLFGGGKQLLNLGSYTRLSANGRAFIEKWAQS